MISLAIDGRVITLYIQQNTGILSLKYGLTWKIYCATNAGFDYIFVLLSLVDNNYWNTIAFGPTPCTMGYSYTLNFRRKIASSILIACSQVYILGNK